MPTEDQRFPMSCGPGADQGYHDDGWLRSWAVADAVGAPILRDQGPDRPHRKARRGLRLPRRAGGPGTGGPASAMPDAQTSKKTLEVLGTDVLTLLVVSVSTMLV
jgi:hypothetical protein